MPPIGFFVCPVWACTPMLHAAGQTAPSVFHRLEVGNKALKPGTDLAACRAAHFGGGISPQGENFLPLGTGARAGRGLVAGADRCEGGRTESNKRKRPSRANGMAFLPGVKPYPGGNSDELQLLAAHGVLASQGF